MLAICYCNYKTITHRKSTMSSPVLTISEVMKVNMQNRTKKGGVYSKGKGWIVGVDHKGGKNQEDDERGGGVCPCCGG